MILRPSAGWLHTYGKVFIVDAMSSFAGVDIPVRDWHIDFLVSSANMYPGVPGFSFIIANRKLLMESKGAREAFLLTSTISKQAWNRTENGATHPRPT